MQNEQNKGGAQVLFEKASEDLNEKLTACRDKNAGYKKEGKKIMSNFNRVVLMGRLTRDPEVKEIAPGRSVADMGLAVTEKYKDKTGEFVEKTCFVDIVAWGRQAETCGEYLKKGSPVLVEGRLQLDQWTNKEGQKRSKHCVKADRVQFLNGKPKENAENPEPGTAEAEALPF